MGAWGIGPFEDDTAYDVIDELEENPDWGPVEDRLKQIASQTGYIEYEVAVHAIAMAALVAAVGGWQGEAQVDLQQVLDSLGPMPSALPTIASAALQRLEGGNSHLYELWQDTDDFEGWLQSMAHLRTYLEIKK